MKNRWNENELKFLIENYETLGAEMCAKKLNRTEKSVSVNYPPTPKAMGGLTNCYQKSTQNYTILHKSTS